MSTARQFLLNQNADYELSRVQFEQTYYGKRTTNKGCFNTCVSQYYRSPKVGPGNPISSPDMGGWNPADQRWRCNIPKVVRDQKGGGKQVSRSSKSRRIKSFGARGYYYDLNNTVGGRPVHRSYSTRKNSILTPSKLVNYNGRTFGCRQPTWNKSCV